MSLALFELAEFEETRQTWAPRFKPFGMTLLSLAIPDRCRDCGTTGDMTAQGSCRAGKFMLCDACAGLDGCTDRVSIAGPEWHLSNWGARHRVDEHDDMVAAREDRRDRYRRKAGA